MSDGADSCPQNHIFTDQDYRDKGHVPAAYIRRFAELGPASDINLTLSRYSHTVLEQQSEAVAMLPSLDIVAQAGVKAGMDGLSCRNTADLGKRTANSDGRSTMKREAISGI